jgi:DNA-binding NtrC family response regulator
MFAAEMGMQEASLGSEALQALEDYYFPGNVRELKNIIEHALIESDGAEIQPEHLHFIQARSIPAASANPPKIEASLATASDLPLDLDQAELTVIKRALAITDGNITRAARMLRTNRMRIYRALAREEESQIKGDE